MRCDLAEVASAGRPRSAVMTDTEDASTLVGPVLRAGEVADALVEAIREDNADKSVNVVERASYLRVQVEGECIIRRDTVERMLGRRFEMRELELHMPSFSGYIRTGSEAVRFILKLPRQDR